MLKTDKKVTAKWLKLAGLVLASGFAGFIGYYTGVFTGRDLEQMGLPGGILWRIMFVVALAGCVTAYLRPKLAGILLLSTFIAMVIYIPSINLERFYAVFASFLPFLIAGIFLLTSWRLSESGKV
ncbi:MAG: hypothetical protein PHU23_05375 [Dehalococcoidales bacterium]|nr:hypothetical protein [Dehalococcoidales bacterium]